MKVSSRRSFHLLVMSAVLGAALAASVSGARLAHVTYGPRPEDGLQILEAGALAAQMLEIPAH